MARFWGTLLLVFGIPIPLLVAAVAFVAVRIGEVVPFSQAARMQQADPEMLWKGYRDVEDARYKLACLDVARPEILVMGESRMGQVRRQMFAPYSFYNMARLAYAMRTYSDLVRRFPADYHPRVIVFTLDFFQFSPRFTAERAEAMPDFASTRREAWLNAFRDVLAELPKHPSLLFAGRHDPKYGRPILGLQAWLNSYGFRQDGSEHLAKQWMEKVADPHMGEDPDAAQKVFFDAPEMGADEMARFEEFTALCREKGIALVGVQMPMYRPMIRRLETDPRYGVLADFRKHLADGWFARQGVLAFDYLDMPGYSDDPRYFWDPIHPNEPAILAALAKAEADPRVQALLPRLDATAIQASLEADKKSDQHIYLYDKP